jgi:hypothetical protein
MITFIPTSLSYCFAYSHFTWALAILWALAMLWTLYYFSVDTIQDIRGKTGMCMTWLYMSLSWNFIAVHLNHHNCIFILGKLNLRLYRNGWNLIYKLVPYCQNVTSTLQCALWDGMTWMSLFWISSSLCLKGIWREVNAKYNNVRIFGMDPKISSQ